MLATDICPNTHTDEYEKFHSNILFNNSVMLDVVQIAYTKNTSCLNFQYVCGCAKCKCILYLLQNRKIIRNSTCIVTYIPLLQFSVQPILIYALPHTYRIWTVCLEKLKVRKGRIFVDLAFLCAIFLSWTFIVSFRIPSKNSLHISSNWWLNMFVCIVRSC